MLRRIAPRKVGSHEAVSGAAGAADRFEKALSHCLQLLNRYPARTLIYDLACLCPEDFDFVLSLVRLDLSQPHAHKRALMREMHPASFAHGKLQMQLRAQLSAILPEEASRFWLELIKRWLLTCPLDPDYGQDPVSADDMFCRTLRSELVERILNIT